MSELLYKQEVFQLVGFCMEIHRELGKGHNEIIYKDGFVVELSRAGIPFLREKITKSPIRESSGLTIIMRTLWSGIRFFLRPKPWKNWLIRTSNKC
jgi:hypothetical protein